MDREIERLQLVPIPSSWMKKLSWVITLLSKFYSGELYPPEHWQKIWMFFKCSTERWQMFMWHKLSFIWIHYIHCGGKYQRFINKPYQIRWVNALLELSDLVGSYWYELTKQHHHSSYDRVPPVLRLIRIPLNARLRVTKNTRKFTRKRK